MYVKPGFLSLASVEVLRIPGEEVSTNSDGQKGKKKKASLFSPPSNGMLYAMSVGNKHRIIKVH